MGDDLFTDIPMTTSVANFPQKISHTPAAVSIVSKEMIAALAPSDIYEIFSLVPGYDAYARSASLGGVSYGAYPAAFSNTLEVKLDGVSMYEVFLNTTIWPNLGIDVEDIDYIEVVRGGNPSVDGANSFAGSINIITNSPANSQPNQIRLGVGGRGERSASVHMARQGSYAAYSFKLKKREHDGFAGMSINDGLDSQSVRFRALFTPNLYDTVDVQLGYADTTLGMTGGGKNDDPFESGSYGLDGAYQAITWQRVLTNGGLRVRGYHTTNEVAFYDYLGTFVDIVGIPPQLIYPDFPYADFDVAIDTRDESSERLDIEVRHHFSATDSVRLDWGLGSRRDSAQSSLFFSTDKSIVETTSRVFVNAEWAASGALVANLGTLWEEGLGHRNVLSLRGALNYQLTPQLSARLARNLVERAPTLMAAREYRTLSYAGYVFDIDRIADPDIKNEGKQVSEMGIYGNFMHGALTIDLKVFKETSSDLIEVVTQTNSPLDFDGRVAFRTNTTHVDLSGVELAVDYTAGDWLWHWQTSKRQFSGSSLRLETYVDGAIEPLKVFDMDNAGPELITSLLVRQQLSSGWSWSSNLRYQAEADYRLGGNVPSYNRLDLALQKTMVWQDKTLQITLSSQNILNNEVIDYQNFNAMGRRFLLRANLSF